MLFEAIRSARSAMCQAYWRRRLVRAIESGAGEALLDPALTQRVFSRVREAQRKDEQFAFSQLTDQEMRVLAWWPKARPTVKSRRRCFWAKARSATTSAAFSASPSLTNRAEAAAYAVRHNIGRIGEE